MPKPQKATAEYFPHYANSGKTMFILESKFGNDGYAAWFKIIEMLTAAENHFYDCRNPDNWEFLLAKTRLSGIIVTEILDLLARLGAINPEFWKHQVIRSDNLIENLSGLYSRRKVNVISNDELKGLLFADTRLTESKRELLHTDNLPSRKNVDIYPQSKVKESKGKETKEEEEEEEEKKPPSSSSSKNTFEVSDFFPEHEAPTPEVIPDDAKDIHGQLLKALNKISLSPEEILIGEKLISTGCTFEDIEAARKEKNKNNLKYLRNIVCEVRDRRIQRKEAEEYEPEIY